jgi:hypothetical protein
MSEESASGSRVTRVGIILLVIAAILIVGDLNRRMTEARRLEQDAALLATQVVERNESTSRLQTQVAGATGDSVVDDWAHSDARLVREGEVLVIPISPSGAESASGRLSGSDSDLPSRLEVWLALIFGK